MPVDSTTEEQELLETLGKVEALYGIRPYRYRRQRHTTVMARVPRRFLDETLWPEFNQLNDVLRSYLQRVTERVIKASIYAEDAEAEVRNEPAALADGRGAPR